jgi:hypothetical protein
VALLQRVVLAAALVAAALPALSLGSAHAAPAPPKPLTAADLPRLTQELQAVTAHAQQLSAELDVAAQRDGGLRVAFGRLEEAKQEAQRSLDRRARQVYMATTPTPIGDWETALANPTLKELSRRGARAALSVDKGLIEAVTSQAAALKALQKQADGQAKVLADAAHEAEIARALEAQRALLDTVSTTVTLALTPAQTARSRSALSNQAPVIDLLERTGSGIPDG